MIVEKDIARVSVGSYVVGIAKQRGGRKIKQKGWVRSLSVIERLIDQGVERVLVDTSKKLPEETEEIPSETIIESIPESSENLNQEEKSATVEGEIESSEQRSNKANFAQSINQAKSIFKEAKSIQRKLLDDVLTGRQIDIGPVEEITDKTTEEIFANPDALACIINIREKDEYLLEHSSAVSILMSIFSRFLDIDIETAKQLSIGAFLHDVGKIKIPDEILNKPGKLTEKEFTVMKTHVIHSVDIIRNTAGISPMSLEVAALHHEKLDGSGYPLGLPENKITQYGRMITICDIFDALTANRVYKDGMAQVKAFAILRNMAEKSMIDLSLVNRFIKCMGVYPVGSLVQLNSNQLAVVESRNSDDPVRPKVKAFFSVSQNHFVLAKDIDLSDDQQNHIEKGVRADDFNLDMNKILEFLVMEG